MAKSKYKKKPTSKINTLKKAIKRPLNNADVHRTIFNTEKPVVTMLPLNAMRAK